MSRCLPACAMCMAIMSPHQLTLKYWVCRTEGLVWDRAGAAGGGPSLQGCRLGGVGPSGLMLPGPRTGDLLSRPRTQPCTLSQVTWWTHSINYITGSTATCLVQRHCLCSHHSTYFWNVLVTATETPPPLAVSTPHHTLLPGKPLIYLLSFWVICVNGIIKHEAFMSGFFHSA